MKIIFAFMTLMKNKKKEFIFLILLIFHIFR